MYTTKVTWLGAFYGCRILKDGVPILEGRCDSRELIGPTFRSLFRTIDKCGGGDSFTHAARMRNSKAGNIVYSPNHIWLVSAK